MLETCRLGDSAPTVKQVRQLSSLVMKEAIDRGKLRRSHRIDKSYGFIDETDLLQDGREDPYTLRHRLSVRMGRRLIEVPAERSYSVGAQEWSMRLADTRFYEHDNDEWIGSRSVVKLVWNGDEVTQAVRSTIAVPSDEIEIEDINDEIYRANQQIDSRGFLDFLDMQSQYHKLTAADVESVTEEVNMYLNQGGR
ncbi:hypothetical protein GX865_00630 [Candidatus Saccharibacteria bacterium]|jgi:hypothetical protein|nr:hypothetical protein [Candidatus Saccharibacteria bacterium]